VGCLRRYGGGRPARHRARLPLRHLPPQSRLFIQSLNETIDVHTKRVQIGARARIPTTIWLVLCGVAFVALAAMGYHQGLTRSSRSVATIAVIITFSFVLWLIVDLDRPGAGTLRVSQQAMQDLRASMNEPVP
jgi:hypothetical protein